MMRRLRSLVIVASLWSLAVGSMFQTSGRLMAESDATGRLVAFAEEKSSSTPRTLEDVIARLKEQEALLHDIEFTTKSVREYGPQPEPRPGAPRARIVGETSVLQGHEETIHQITQGERLNATHAFAMLHTTGETLVTTSTVVSDGSATVAIVDGNSGTLFRRRYEPPWVAPPHSWGAFTLNLAFPLSVYLEGTEALKKHPKVSHNPIERGSAGEFPKVEAEFVGEERVDDLPCIKLKVLRWHYTKNPPTMQHLWLATERNYHVVRCEWNWERRGKQFPGERTRVAKWRKVKEGIWLPGVVESVIYRYPGADNQAEPVVGETRRLTLGPVKLEPDSPGDFFALPPIPDGIPKFIVDAEGALEDSPMHPRSIPARDGTTLESILENLAAEERKYDHYESEITETYLKLNRQSSRARETLESSSRVRSVFQGERLYSFTETRHETAGRESKEVTTAAFDGAMFRNFRSHSSGSDEPKPNRFASFFPGRAEEVQVIRPHHAVFRGERNRQSLAVHLKSGWYDQLNHYAMSVEYVGDAVLGGLHCHQLKCDMLQGNPPVVTGSTHIWLARDRNLIPVRREGHSNSRPSKLPNSITFVDELREIRPGLWFPYHTAILSFQSFGIAGLDEGRPLLQWRRDLRTTSIKLDPAVDPALFSRLEVTEGTRVQVQDEHYNLLGQYEQERNGPLDVSLERMLTLRQSAKLRKEESQRRKATLEALGGQPAPELPQEGWLNSAPRSWKDFGGKVVVVHVWATWWDGSPDELKQLSQAVKSWEKQGAADRAAIGIHTAGTDRNTITKAVAANGIEYPIVIDAVAESKGSIWGTLFERFAVPQLPIAYVVDRNGNLAAHGPLAEMLAKADELARQPSKRP